MSSLLASTDKTYSSSLTINCDTPTVTDISAYNHTITLNNGVTYDTTNKYLSFDGNDDYALIADHSSLGMGTSDFTAECWVYPEAFSTNGSDLSALIENRISSTSGGFLLWIGSDATFTFYISASGNSVQRAISSLSNVILNRWTHVAGVRENGVLRLYINGVLHATETSASGSPDNLSPSNSSNILLGTACDDSGAFRNLQGKLDNIRIVKGVALYNKQFTPIPRNHNLSKNANKLPNTVNHLILTTTKNTGSVAVNATTTSGYYSVHWWDGTKTTQLSGTTTSKPAIGGTQIFYIYPSTSSGNISGYLQAADLSNNALTGIRAPYCVFLSDLGVVGTIGGYWTPPYYSVFVPGYTVLTPGAPYILNVSSNILSSSALDQLYTDLSDGNGSINVTDNTGTGSDTPSIATDKGYTIIGS